jgi:uncharacterized repeat protein (TIGR01451 family)
MGRWSHPRRRSAVAILATSVVAGLLLVGPRMASADTIEGNQAPTAQGPEGVVTTPPGTPVPITLQGNDPDGDSLSFQVPETSSYFGAIGYVGEPICTVGTAPSTCTQDVQYTPPSEFTGEDSFTFTVRDPSEAASEPATVSIVVQPEPDTSSSSAPPAADLSVAPLVDAPDPVTGGGTIRYTTTVTNNGPEAASGVELKLNGDSSESLPAFTTFVSGSAGSAVCTSTEGGPVLCPVGDLASGSTADVTIYLRADTVESTTTTPVIVSVFSASYDPNSEDNGSSTTTTINPASSTSATVFVPPSTQDQTVATSDTVTVLGQQIPIAQPGDTTAAALTVPPNGPGGVVTVDEQACQTPFVCTTPGGRGTAPTGSLIDDKVVLFLPPTAPFYDNRNPVTYSLSYDRSIVSGTKLKDLRIFYVKDTSPTVLRQARLCPLRPNATTVFPCIQFAGFILSRNAQIHGDLLVRLRATFDDPKIGTYKG